MTKQRYHHGQPETRNSTKKLQSESESFDARLPAKTHTKEDEEKLDEFVIQRLEDIYGVNRKTAINIYKYPPRTYTQKTDE